MAVFTAIATNTGVADVKRGKRRTHCPPPTPGTGVGVDYVCRRGETKKEGTWFAPLPLERSVAVPP